MRQHIPPPVHGGDYICRPLFIPDTAEWMAVYNRLISMPTHRYFWETTDEEVLDRVTQEAAFCFTNTRYNRAVTRAEKGSVGNSCQRTRRLNSFLMTHVTRQVTSRLATPLIRFTWVHHSRYRAFYRQIYSVILPAFALNRRSGCSSKSPRRGCPGSDTTFPAQEK